MDNLHILCLFTLHCASWPIFTTLLANGNTVVSNHFHSVKILLFSSARSCDFNGTPGTELPVSMYTTKTPIDMCRFNHRGSQLYFHITRYVLKEEGGHPFLLPNVKVEFRHLFSLQKRFSLCSSHKINANIVVFCWLTGLQWNNTRFKIPSGLDNFLSYSIPVYTDLILRWVFIGRRIFENIN